MAAKKILFIIVEGPSDEASLGLVLSRLYQPLPVHIEIVHGDITTEKGTTTVNIISKVAEIIKGYARNNHVTPKHFQQIVHIVDTDGVYIDDKYIMEDLQVKDTVYSTEEIYTSSVSRIANRNKQKRANLNKLSATSKIWNIPYQVFYMSCNLEHVLHNKCNNTDCEKKRMPTILPNITKINWMTLFRLSANQIFLC